jgi:hypothetical protein
MLGVKAKISSKIGNEKDKVVNDDVKLPNCSVIRQIREGVFFERDEFHFIFRESISNCKSATLRYGCFLVTKLIG